MVLLYTMKKERRCMGGDTYEDAWEVIRLKEDVWEVICMKEDVWEVI